MDPEETIVLDQELVAQTIAGSLPAFEQLICRYEQRIYRFVLQSCRQPDDALEITQDTFVRAFQALARFDSRFAFAPWLFAIARRKCLDFHRVRARAKRSAVVSASDSVLPDLPDWTDHDPSQVLANREEKENLWTVAREKLSSLQFQALWLKYFEDMDIAAISRSLDKTIPHIKVLLFRARQLLRKELERTRHSPFQPSPCPATAAINPH